MEPQCSQKSLGQSDLEGVWDAFHYMSDRYFSLRLHRSGKGTLAFVSGPPHAPSRTLFEVNSAGVSRGSLHAVAVLPLRKIVIEGCVVVSGSEGIIEKAHLTMSGANGEFPQTLSMTFTRGEGFLNRMIAFQKIAAAMKEGWQPPPEKGPSAESKADAEVDFSVPWKLERPNGEVQDVLK